MRLLTALALVAALVSTPLVAQDSTERRPGSRYSSKLWIVPQSTKETKTNADGSSEVYWEFRGDRTWTHQWQEFGTIRAKTIELPTGESYDYAEFILSMAPVVMDLGSVKPDGTFDVRVVRGNLDKKEKPLKVPGKIVVSETTKPDIDGTELKMTRGVVTFSIPAQYLQGARRDHGKNDHAISVMLPGGITIGFYDRSLMGVRGLLP